MNELFGLLDALESTVLEGKRVPLTDRIMVEEKKVLSLISKMRLAMKSNGKAVRKSVEINGRDDYMAEDLHRVSPLHKDSAASLIYTETNSREAMETARLEAEKMKNDAYAYADTILATLMTLVAKLQKNVVSMEKSIGNSRQLLEKDVQQIVEEGVLHDALK